MCKVLVYEEHNFTTYAGEKKIRNLTDYMKVKVQEIILKISCGNVAG